MDTPGFGWANPQKSAEKVVITHGKGFEVGDMDSGYAGQLVQKFTSENGLRFAFTVEEFNARLKLSVEKYFDGIGKREELTELLTKGTSNGRALKWEMMSIAPNCAFKLHAHPNVEMIHVVWGKLHEFRFRGPPPKDYSVSPEDTEGPDFSARPDAVFGHEYTEERGASEDPTAGFLFNEKGSVHLSYTSAEGAHLMVLWSGCHANVPRDKYPPAGIIPAFPAGVESLHKDPHDK